MNQQGCFPNLVVCPNIPDFTLDFSRVKSGNHGHRATSDIFKTPKINLCGSATPLKLVVLQRTVMPLLNGVQRVDISVTPGSRSRGISRYPRDTKKVWEPRKYKRFSQVKKTAKMYEPIYLRNMK